MKKEEKKSPEGEPSTGFLQGPCQNFKVPFYETLPVGYFRCVSIISKKTNEVTIYRTLISSSM